MANDDVTDHVTRPTTPDGATTDDGSAPATRATEHYLDEKVEGPAAGHTWGAAVTSLVGPTEETVGAVDPDEPAKQERRGVEDLMQEAITAVASTHGGTHSREVVRDALQRELEARGRWPQPEPWLDAVASEIEAGGVYTMSTATTEPGVEPGAPSESAETTETTEPTEADAGRRG